MAADFSFSQLVKRFPDDETCLEEIKKFRYPKGIHCASCRKITRHYKVSGRKAYACKQCRNQVFPLADTIFDKSTTPLRLWFYALYIMVQTRGEISIKQLQHELGVTYKTAWRMYSLIYLLMEQNGGDLLREPQTEDGKKIHKWVFFNTLEIKVVEKRGNDI